MATDDPHRKPTRQLTAIDGGNERQAPFRTDPEWVAIQAERASRNSYAALQACEGLADNFDTLSKNYEALVKELRKATESIAKLTGVVETIQKNLLHVQDKAAHAEVVAQTTQKSVRDSRDEDDVEVQLAKQAVAERELSLRARQLELENKAQQDGVKRLEEKRASDAKWTIIGKGLAVVVAVLGAVGTLALAAIASQTRACTAGAAEPVPMLLEGGGGQGGSP